MSTDVIAVTGLRAFGRHGVFDFERDQGQEFVVDVALHLDISQAAASDDLADTVDYGALSFDVVALVQAEPVALIERLADQIAGLCLRDPRVRSAEVVVHKPQAPVTVPFSDVTVTVVRRRTTTVVVALGANLGDRRATLQGALFGLQSLSGTSVRAVSPVYETPPMGPPQPDYLNAVVLLDSQLQPPDLLDQAHAIETAFGRVRAERWGPRTLDIDLICVGGVVLHTDRLHLPHPGAAGRAFVLVPWLDVDPDAVLPGVGPVAAALAALPARERQSLRRLDELALAVPAGTPGGRGDPGGSR